MFKVYEITSDASIRSDKPSLNAGQNNQLYVYNTKFSDLTLTLQSTVNQARTLLFFDAESILTEYGQDVNYDVSLNMNFSNYKTESPSTTITSYPLSNSFMEGFGYNFDRNEGVTWNNRITQTPWVQQGGDYDDQFLISNGVLDNSNRKIKFDISSYISYISSNTNNGIILMNEDESLVRASFYSRHSPTQMGSYVIMFKDTYTVNAGSSILFRDGNIMYDDFLIRPLPYQSNIKKGNIFICYLTVEDIYSRTSFSYSTSVSYLPNLQYRIVDYTRSQEFIPPSVNNKISVNNGLYIRFSTMNFPEGKYYIEPIYDDGIIRKTGQPIYFNVVDEQYYTSI